MATVEHCVYCFESLIAHFDKKPVPKPKFENEEYPLFVSWHKHNNNNSRGHSLRGCKGTFNSLQIHDGLAQFALISALKDTRFSPVEAHEVPRLECSVSLLCKFEACSDAFDWEIGKHGIIIDFSDPKKGKDRNATYLPQVAVEQDWNKEQALQSLVQKAGYDGAVSESLISSIKCTRYQSSEKSLLYEGYVNHKNGNGRGNIH